MADLLCVGLTTLDVIHVTDAPPSPNTKITASQQYVAAGGPAANAAVVASTLGSTTTLVSALGSGAAAQIAAADLAACGVSVRDIATDHELAISAVLVSSATGERTVTSLDGGAADPAVPNLGEFDAPKAVLLDGHYPSLCLQVATWAKRHGALVILDAGRWRPVFAQLIPLADMVAASADFQFPDQSHGPAALVAAGAKVGIVTHGGSAVEYAGPETSAPNAAGAVEVPNVTVLDTLGAGDCFHGALAHALAVEGAKNGTGKEGDAGREGETGSTGAEGEASQLSDAKLRSCVNFAINAASIRVQYRGPRAYLTPLRETLGAATL